SWRSRQAFSARMSCALAAGCACAAPPTSTATIAPAMLTMLRPAIRVSPRGNCTSQGARRRAPCGRAPLGLLDGGEQPGAAAIAHEGPDLGRLAAHAIAAVDDAAVGEPTGVVEQAEAHRHGGVLDTALAPRLRQVALLELDRFDLVLDAAAGVG